MSFIIALSENQINCYNSASRCMADPAPQMPTGQTAPDSDSPKTSRFELSASHLCFSSVQFTKNHVCKAYLAAKRVQSSHGIQNLASNSEKDYTVAFGEIILAARLELALLKQLSALPSFPHRNCKSLHGIAQSLLTPWEL